MTSTLSSCGYYIHVWGLALMAVLNIGLFS